MTTVTVRHIDTCLSCYVLDHCNGDNELLLGVSVDRGTRHYQLRAALLDEWHSNCDERVPESVTDDVFRSAVLDCFSSAHPLATFDRGLDYSTEDSETCFAWFKVSWE